MMSSRRALAIEGRFYTNGLELKHKLQKKRLKEAEVPREVSSVTEEQQNWAQDYFLVDPIKWNRWGLEREAQHIIHF